MGRCVTEYKLDSTYAKRNEVYDVLYLDWGFVHMKIL